MFERKRWKSSCFGQNLELQFNIILVRIFEIKKVLKIKIFIFARTKLNKSIRS